MQIHPSGEACRADLPRAGRGRDLRPLDHRPGRPDAAHTEGPGAIPSRRHVRWLTTHALLTQFGDSDTVWVLSQSKDPPRFLMCANCRYSSRGLRQRLALGLPASLAPFFPSRTFTESQPCAQRWRHGRGPGAEPVRWGRQRRTRR